MTTDLKKLKRAGVEPARVFGRRDFDPKAAGEVLHYTFAGADYYSPAFPTWMLLDGDCGVIDKAITRYGMREAPVTGGWVEYATRLFADAGVDVTLDEPLDYSLSNGVIVSAYPVPSAGVVPATPVMYLLRRFGEDLSFQYDGSMFVIRVRHEGECVGVIRTIAADCVTLWTPEDVAA